jgi:hypothetical protein
MPATRRQPRQATAIAAQSHPGRYFISALQHCHDAIVKRNEPPRTPRLFITSETPDVKIQRALENYEIATEQRKIQEYKAMFALGQGLIEVVAAQESPRFNISHAADAFGVIKNRAQIAVRIYTTLREWPGALDHMTKMPLANWRHITDGEVGLLQLRLSGLFGQATMPYEWDSTYGSAITGYQLNEDTNELTPIYGAPQATRLDIRDYVTPRHDSEESSQVQRERSRERSTDQGWFSHND